ncbi:hypothetical protein B0H10DRAFT_1994458 [Mycena sp. CBHHK59/15]|nr:hypothetical protein B0H10DRAFT_1994458 [Mycena sp. CBHHK59/15]
MSTPSTHTPAVPPPADQDEPDEEWKTHQRQLIERRGLQGVNASEAGALDKRASMTEAFKDEIAAIKRMARRSCCIRRRLTRELGMSEPEDSNHASRTGTQEQFASESPPAAADSPLSAPDPEPEPHAKETGVVKDDAAADGRAEEGPGALTIKMTRLPTEPPVNGSVGWVKASDAARKYELAIRQRANSKTEVTQAAPPPPPPPPKKWVSASDAARRTAQRKAEAQGA